MQKLSFPEVWHFQSPHIITTLNSETPKQEALEVPSVSLARRTAEEPCCLSARGLAEITGTLARELRMCSHSSPPTSKSNLQP